MPGTASVALLAGFGIQKLNAWRTLMMMMIMMMPVMVVVLVAVVMLGASDMSGKRCYE